MLPVVLVVVDIAVLRRVGPDDWAGPGARRVWREKLPYFGLCAVFLVLAILAKRSNDSLISIQHYGLAVASFNPATGSRSISPRQSGPLDWRRTILCPSRRRDSSRSLSSSGYPQCY